MTKVEALNDELKEFIVSVSWSHKYLIAQFDLDSHYACWLKYAKVLFSVIASGCLMCLVSLFSERDQEGVKHFLTGVSLIALVVVTTLESISKVGNFEEHAIKCRSLANDYCDLKDDGRSLFYRLKGGEETDSLRVDFEILKEKRKILNRSKPSVSRRAEKLATKKLKKNKDDKYQDDYETLGLVEG